VLPHSNAVQHALVHEHIIQVLSEPHNVQKFTTVIVKEKPLELTGYSCAHWAALCFVVRLANNNGGMLKELANYSESSVERIKDTYVFQVILAPCGLECIPFEQENGGATRRRQWPFCCLESCPKGKAARPLE
jgi:hypothetical protein